MIGYTDKKDVADLDISQTHDIISTTIISSSEINRKATRILSHLSKFSCADVKTKPIMMEIRADGPAVSKAVSIVEIVKRELAQQGAKCYQYSILEPKVKQIARKDEPSRDGEGGRTVAGWEKARGNTSTTGNGAHTTTTTDGNDDHPMAEDEEVGEEEEDDADGPAFEEMRRERGRDGSNNAAANVERPKYRAVPRLIMNLSRVRSEKLKTLYGEQTNSEK